ncbi:SdrD B-like domain-containing protein [Cellulomonas sp. ICMP 17802]|uniref:SdrD B-like domain-containing protein n=1 Tax=Cellulomonas sp. ICMP 17802 TaxID=3239199 RepID=UPI00351B6ADE
MATALVSGLATLSPTIAPVAHAATTCPAAGCAVTVDARDLPSGAPLGNFTYIINVDNTKLPDDPLAVSTQSNSAIVAEGNQDRTAVNLPAGRYLISVRSLDHKMWGKHITVPNPATPDGSLNARIDLSVQSGDHPLPLGKIRVFVFQDNAWANGAPDTEEGGLQGFQVGLEEQTHSAVTVDYNNDPLCGGTCLTADDGFVQLDNLGPATYFIDVHPPAGPCNSDPTSQWYQTTTIDGGLQLLASVEEGSDGTGAPGEQLWEAPNNRTAYWFGFVCAPQAFATPGTGEITGTALNWVEWAPYTTGTFNDPVENAFVALSDSTTDRTVYVGQADGSGSFDIQNVPAGSYNLAVWDEQLSYIMRFKPVTVAAGETVDVNETGDDGSVGLGVSRWFGWLDGHVYKDTNGNGKRDPGEPTIANTDVDQRWRDGSIKEATFTDSQGYYSYPTAEGGALGRWFVNEQGFARFSAYPGPSLHDEITDAVTPSCSVVPPTLAPANPCIPTDQGGGLLTNQLLLEGHRSTVDWGKRDYPPGTPGQIVGITYFSTTRNEFDARFQAHEDYEPAIPDVTVLLEGLGPDGQPNTADDTILNKYVTDHWQQPSADQDPQADGNAFTQSCNPIRDFSGTEVTGQFAAKIGPNCLEVPLTGAHTKDGAFDGGYAFADYCPNGYDTAADDGTCTGGSDPVPLVAGTYITHVVMPKDAQDTRPCNPANTDGFKAVSSAKGVIPGDGEGCLYRPVREEDVNVDLGNKFTPAIPPPACTGDDHVIDQTSLVTRSTYYGVAGAHAPLCDKRLVVLTNGQNANADFNMMTNFRTDPNGTDAADARTGDVPEPGRLVGQVFNDIYFERNLASPWYGEPRPIVGIPVGIYARVDTVCPQDQPGCATPNVNLPYDANNWRLLTTVTTSPDGSFEALVPSTETFNCPIPQGPCPGMYLVKVDDPGSKAQPNAGYNPNLLTATTPAEAWPGLTTQLDLPLDPISGTGCEDPAVPARPEVLQVSTPYVPNAVAANGGNAANPRRITIQADFIGTAGPTGATGGRVTLTDDRTGGVTTLTRANGGIVSWTPGSGAIPDTIVIQVPALSLTFPAGQKQLAITTANANGGVSSVNGITVHALGTGGGVTYNPPVVNVAAPPPGAGTDAHAIQNAIDGAAAGSLLVLRPGVYNENVVQWKPLKIQGLGAGGIIGAHELQARDPEDPRFHITGSVIDGRYFQQNATAYDAVIAAHAPYAVDATLPAILRGADLTLVAKTTTAYDVPSGAIGVFSAARTDGVGLMTGQGEGAGGIQVQANVNNLQVTNTVLENNGGVVAGGIAVGQPYAPTSHNYNVRMAYDRFLGNGGLTQAGGVGIFDGSNNYELANSIVCSNFSVNYGAGVSHIGLSPNGSIHDNQIYYNDSVDSGGGLAIESELPVGGGLGAGTGPVNVDRNLLAANFSGDDGGAVFVLDALTAAINLRDNLVVDNGAADIAGGIMLDDSSNVRIISTTVANNVSTASSENSDGLPHSAGLASEANDPLFQATLPAGSPDFSRPAALFDNVFWNNTAYTLSQPGPGATLVNQGVIDLEIHGTTNNADTFTPRYSDLTNGQILGPDGVQRPVPAGQGNISVDPLFVNPIGITNELTVTGSRLDPQTAAVTLTAGDPPVGLTSDFHLTGASPVVDRGVRCSNTAFPAPATALNACTGGGIQAPTLSPALGGLGDYDGQYRPMLRTLRVRTPWDLGADELVGVPVVLP